MRNISSVLGRLAKSVSVGLMLLFAVTMAHAQDVKEGETLFKSKCTTCHSVTRNMVGPALAGMSEMHSEEWLVAWIKNSQAMIASGDEVAVQLFNDWNKLVMTSFTDLSDDQIKSIIAYVEAEEAKAANPDEGGAGGAGAAQSNDANLLMIFGLAAIVVLAIIVIVVLNRVIRTLEKVVASNQAAIEAAEAQNEQFEENRFGKFAKAFIKNKKLVGFAVLMLVAFLGVWGWNVMWNVGVHTGYQPVQPIKFSHQIHAGRAHV